MLAREIYQSKSLEWPATWSPEHTEGDERKRQDRMPKRPRDQRRFVRLQIYSNSRCDCCSGNSATEVRTQSGKMSSNKGFWIIHLRQKVWGRWRKCLHTYITWTNWLPRRVLWALHTLALWSPLPPSSVHFMHEPPLMSSPSLSPFLLSPSDGTPIVYNIPALSISLPLISIATKYLYPPSPHSERHHASKSTRLLFLDASTNQLSMTTGCRRPDQSDRGILFPALFARHSLFIDSRQKPHIHSLLLHLNKGRLGGLFTCVGGGIPAQNRGLGGSGRRG